MNVPTLTVEQDPQAADLEVLRDGLSQHAREFVAQPGFVPLAVFLKDDGQVVGGVSGTTSWGWLYVALLWVDENQRGQGLGRRLMGAVENAAMARGCSSAHVDTFSFQARRFYEALGYSVFGALEDYPPGHRRVFLRKALNAANATREA